MSEPSPGEAEETQAALRMFLVRRVDTATWVVDGAGIVLYANAAMGALLDAPLRELPGSRALDWVAPEDRPEVARVLEALTSGRSPSAQLLRFRVLARDGRTVSAACEASRIFAEPGHVAELRPSEEPFRRIVESASEGIITLDASGNVSFVNQRLADILGFERHEFLGKSVHDLVDPALRESAAEHLERRRRGEAETYQIPFRHKDGREVWTQVKSSPLIAADGTFEGSIALVTDITDRRRAGEARSQLAAIVESSHDAIVGTDSAGTITSWNRGAEKLYGYSANEIVGRPVSVLVPDGRIDEEAAILSRVGRGEAVDPLETSRRRKDGSFVEVALMLSPVRDGEGRIVGASKIARDLTERRRADALLRRTEEQLRQAQKLEAIASLAGGIAHDFNNLLSVILTYTSLALGDLPEGAPLAADLAEVQHAGERAAKLTKQLLAFSRQQILAPQTIDLNESIRALRSVLTGLLGEHISLSLQLSPRDCRVFADPGQIEQVVMNLAMNAHDAMEKGGSLLVETRLVSLDAAAAEETPGLSAGRYVVLSVVDSGSGMDAATRARVFEPFFTTKGPGKGTGLGLSTVYGIVKQSGGTIAVESDVGKGTAFDIYFPASAESRAALAASTPAATLAGTETVLVVEDEDAVRSAMRLILRKHGYHVLEAANGGEALLFCEEFAGRIDLLVTDVVMPRMSGRALADRLRGARPEMRVLYVSGYTDDRIVHHGVQGGTLSVLQKPFTPETLARSVRAVLDAREPRRVVPP